jgi:hypothetical protein
MGGTGASRFTPAAQRPPEPASLLQSFIIAGLAGGIAMLAVLLGWRGSDLPAHLLRIHLIERDGLGVWNNFWYGGHHTVSYGLAVPVLGALFGVWTVAVVSAALSAFLADRLILVTTGRRNLWASLWFAVGTLTNVAIGRLPFSVGMTVGLFALLAAQHGRMVLAAAAAMATATASPVASAFLALIFTVWAIVEPGRRRFLIAPAVASALPLLVIALLYPQGGTFGFRWEPLLWTVAVCATFWFIVPARHRVVRAIALVYALAAAVTFLIPNPLGSNVVRLGMYAAGPVLLALVPARRLMLVVLVPSLLWWQWSPAFDAIARASDDPSTTEAYYAPLRQFLRSADAEIDRVEVVPTKRHWEAAYVAVDLPLARGWERQLDRRFNALFYEPELSPEAYHEWLLESGVSYVALPRTDLDYSAQEEARLLERGQPYLRPVFRSANWQVWEVRGSTGLVDGPAQLVHLDTQSLSLRVLEPGDVTVRVHGSAYWVSDPPLCIEATDDDWIVLRNAQPGFVELSLDEADVLGLNDPCN